MLGFGWILQRKALNIVRLTPSEYEKFKNQQIALTNSSSETQIFGRYAVAAFGRRRTTIHALNFIERNSGWRLRTQLLRKYRMSEHLFTDPMGPISIGFISDLCDELYREHGYRDENFFRMGAYAGLARKNAAMVR